MTEIEYWLPRLTVKREVTISDRRRPDLILRARGYFCIVIENKVDAPEGDGQLEAYADWLLNREPVTALIFLTTGGRSSSGKVSIDRYLRISYRDDIKGWLEKCLEGGAIRASSIEAFVRDYIRTLPLWSDLDDDNS